MKGEGGGRGRGGGGEGSWSLIEIDEITCSSAGYRSSFQGQRIAKNVSTVE